MTVEKEWASETAISTGPDTNVSALAFDGESITVGGLRFKRGRNMSAPYMPMYWGDYLGDTQHLTAIEHGGYLLLIAHYWRTGGIPSDPVKLARICRMSNREWTRHGDTILEFFSDGKHGRIDRELQKVCEKTAKMRNAAETRWNREREPKPLKSLAPVDADALPLQDKCNDNQNQIQIHKKEASLRSNRGTRLPNDWSPDGEQLAFARGLGVDGLEQGDRFRDYWIAQPGQKGVKLDWNGTWRNWVRRAAERSPAQTKRETPSEIGRRILREIEHEQASSSTSRHSDLLRLWSGED
jgi:uncharacterized protein YdaU (DUF1376 family)